MYQDAFEVLPQSLLTLIMMFLIYLYYKNDLHRNTVHYGYSTSLEVLTFNFAEPFTYKTRLRCCVFNQRLFTLFTGVLLDLKHLHTILQTLRDSWLPIRILCSSYQEFYVDSSYFSNFLTF